MLERIAGVQRVVDNVRIQRLPSERNSVMRTLALILVGAAVILVLTVGVGLLPRLLDPFDAAEIADLPFKTSFKVQAGNHVPLDGEFVSTLYGVWALSRGPTAAMERG